MMWLLYTLERALEKRCAVGHLFWDDDREKSVTKLSLPVLLQVMDDAQRVSDGRRSTVGGHY